MGRARDRLLARLRRDTLVTGVRIMVPLELDDAVIEAIAVRVVSMIGQAQPSASPWLTVTDAAAYLAWPKDRIYKLTSAGAIPHRKHGNRITFRREELDEWLDGFREGPRTAWKPSAVVSADFHRSMDTGIAS